MTDESSILHRIRELVDDEHRLRGALQRGEIADDEEVVRVRRIEEELDQCWDLLRQRRARAEMGQDPDEAEARPTGTVEGYIQ
jgi:hypothetical protein